MGLSPSQEIAIAAGNAHKVFTDAEMVEIEICKAFASHRLKMMKENYEGYVTEQISGILEDFKSINDQCRQNPVGHIDERPRSFIVEDQGSLEIYTKVVSALGVFEDESQARQDIFQLDEEHPDSMRTVDQFGNFHLERIFLLKDDYSHIGVLLDKVLDEHDIPHTILLTPINPSERAEVI